MNKRWASLLAARDGIVEKINNSETARWSTQMQEVARKIASCSPRLTTLRCWGCDTDPYTISSWFCRNRACPICSGMKASRHRARIAPILETAQLRWITLTIPSEPDLSAQLAGLYVKMKRLLRSRWWRDRVHGGAWSMETTHHREGDHIKTKRGHVHLVRQTGWHAHVHMIYEGHWIDQKELSQKWQTVSKAMIVAIGQVRGERGLAELIKYELKAATVPPEQFADFLAATASRRTFQTFGTWHGMPDPRKHIQAWKPQLTTEIETLFAAQVDQKNYTIRIPTRQCKHCGSSEFLWTVEDYKEAPEEVHAALVDYHAESPIPRGDPDPDEQHKLPPQPRPPKGPLYSTELTRWREKQ